MQPWKKKNRIWLRSHHRFSQFLCHSYFYFWIVFLLFFLNPNYTLRTWTNPLSSIPPRCHKPTHPPPFSPLSFSLRHSCNNSRPSLFLWALSSETKPSTHYPRCVHTTGSQASGCGGIWCYQGCCGRHNTLFSLGLDGWFIFTPSITWLNHEIRTCNVLKTDKHTNHRHSPWKPWGDYEITHSRGWKHCLLNVRREEKSVNTYIMIYLITHNIMIVGQ